MKLHPLALALAATLNACSLAPPLERPVVDTPAQWQETPPAIDGHWQAAVPADDQARGEWWTLFGDATLSGLITDAANANQDLAAAAARLEQSRSLVRTAAAARLPRFDFGAGAGAGKPENLGPRLGTGSDLPAYERYSFGLSASYEIDLFGRVRDRVRAANEDLGAQQALYQSLLLSLQADVARTYFLVRQTDAEFAVLVEGVTLREHTVRLFTQRVEAGDVGELELAQAQAELASARTEVLGVGRARAQYRHALAILLGKAPASFKLPVAALPATAPLVPAGLPSTLLERRPDIASAERRLAAANARIGVAKAAFYPLLNLTASAGFASGDLGELFSWSARTWSLGPLAGALLALPLFDGGRNKANLANAEAVLVEETALYRQAVLNAFGEVEDALVGMRTLAGQQDTVAATEAAARRALRIAGQRFEAGAAPYLTVLDAQRQTLLAARTQQQLQGARLQTTVAFIRALGGSW